MWLSASETSGEHSGLMEGAVLRGKAVVDEVRKRARNALSKKILRTLVQVQAQAIIPEIVMIYHRFDIEVPNVIL